MYLKGYLGLCEKFIYNFQILTENIYILILGREGTS